MRMDATQTTSPVTAATSVAIADAINTAFAAGEITTVNGRTIASRYGRPAATAWLNGTVSVAVTGRRPRTTGTVYAKPGQTLQLS